MSAPQSPTADDRKRGLPVWKKLLFSLVVFVAFAAALELAFAVCGVRPVVDLRDPYVGFASNLPLFVDRDDDGQDLLTTAPNKLSYFNLQHFPRKKGPGTYRIFCLGGSTTYGRPYDDNTSFCGWLRRFLCTADPTRNWEVINAGGISYASYRVANLMEELAKYNPDLFIIYSGHNEFLERRTYRPMLSTPAGLRTVAGALCRTRTYAALCGLLATNAAAGQPGPQNRRDMLPAEVDAILDHSVGPRDYKRNDRLQSRVIQHYRLNLKRMVQIARRSGAEVVLVVPASNLRDCSPFKSTHAADLRTRDRVAFTRLLEQSRSLLSRGEAKSALEAADRALRIDRRFAELHFVRGQILFKLKLFGQAKESFLRAVEEDICPLRALPDMEHVVREVAAELQVPCIDFAAIVQQRAKHQIPGSDWFLDHVHPTIAGHRLLAELIVDEALRQGIVEPDLSWGPERMDEIAREVEAGIDQRAHGIALRNLSQVLGWAGKLDEAAALSDLSLALAPDDPATQFQAGIVAEDRHDLAAAEVHYRKARELDPKFSAAYINLGIVLGKQRKYAEARAEFEIGLKQMPECEPLLTNLALSTSLQGDYAAAAEFQRLAIRFAPPARRAELENQLSEFLAKTNEQENGELDTEVGDE